jgi:hypothetical protein
MKRIHIFALRPDILALLAEIETIHPIKYTLATRYTGLELDEWFAAEQIPNLGTADSEQTSGCQSFLLTYPSIEIRPRRIRQLNGIVRYDVDQLINPDTVVLTPGGRWKEIVIAGRIATTSNTDVAQSIMSSAVRAVRRRFTKVSAY